MLKAIVASAVLMGFAHADVVATFRQNGETDARVDRFPALSVPTGQAPTPFLKPGKFEVEWTGSIRLKERRRLYFSFEGQGAASFTIDGKEAVSEEGTLGKVKSKRLRLNPGAHDISVKYVSPEDGSGSFRLYWEGDEIPRQTIPPTVYEVELDDTALMGELKRHGRMVFAEQNCAKCHAPESGFGTSPMPEVVEIAPVLAGIGDRVSEEWLRKWIADPTALQPNTRMPHMVDPATPGGLQQAADLAAFLSASKIGGDTLIDPDVGLAKAGGVYFHELGCIACHDPAGDEGKEDGMDRVPLNNVASKYLPGQLVAFLKKPEAYHPFTAMPNFQFSDAEAESLAAFLRSESDGKQTKLDYEFPKGDAARGAEISESLQCGTCHPGLPGGVSKAVSLDGIFKVDWAEKGCLSEDDPRGNLPVPNLRNRDLGALLAFSKHGSESLRKDSSSEFAVRQLNAKSCTACHTMDEGISLLDSLHGTTAGLAAHVEGLGERVDQTRPQLTFIGEMLYTNYIESMLAGTVAKRPRPWLGTRMPAFKSYAKPLAEGLSRMHGFEPSEVSELETQAELVKIGELLVGPEGFACTTCHGIGDKEPTAAFEVGAINFELVPNRLREGYYHRWMDHPAAVVPGNKMPRYAEGNESQRGDILGGDASQQYEAIWHWLHSESDD